MKKIHLIILVLAGMAALRVGAQTDVIDPAEQFVFGIKGGANYSNVWDERGDDFRADAKLGGVIGLFVGIPVGPYLGVQVEGLLAQKGFQAGGTLLGNEYTMKKTKTSLDFPLQVALKPVEYVTILAGPQYSYLLKEKTEYKYGENSSAQEEIFNADNVRKNTLGFVFGLDVNIQHVVLSGRAGWDFQTNAGDGSSSAPRYKNQWLQFTVGFRI
jgi:hypothetical protein